MPEDFEDSITDELKTLMEFPACAADSMIRFKQIYAQAGASPDYLR